MSLMLHSGSADASRDQVFEVKTPKATGRWYPISHGTMVEVVQQAIKSAGLTVKNEKFGLMGKLKEKFFGVFEVDVPGPKPKEPVQAKPYSLMIGVRNSIDKSMAAGICFGAHVTVCDNMCFSGEVTVIRKHTKGIMRVLPQQALEAVKKYPGFAAYQDRLYKRLMEIDPAGNLLNMRGMTPALPCVEAVDHLLMESYRMGVIPASGVGRVYDIWKDPPHDEFKIPSAWSLLNAFTEYMKGIQATNPEEAASRTIRLTGLFNNQFMSKAA